MEQRIAYLLNKLREGALMPAEEAELDLFFAEERNREIFNRVAALHTTTNSSVLPIDQTEWEPLLVDILSADKTAEKRGAKRIFILPVWWRMAAAVLILIVVSGLLLRQKIKGPGTHHQVAALDMPPGTNKAILQLSNGNRIVLSDAQNGVIGRQGNVQVIKLDSGRLAYQQEPAGNETVVVYNTLITPRGGQFKVLLPDGSAVWLNAASSLRYPSSFIGNDRVVELTGEAYFEVAPDAKRPFRVRSKDQEVLVLGTHFNINTYADEPAATTTLISGKVKVDGTGFSGILQPGEQARLQGGNWQLLKAADLDQVIAWKNGYFSFDRADITTVMRQLARWYDVNVIFETKNTQQAFIGEIPRNVSLEKAMQILKLSDIRYTVTGKTVRITD
ncbi:FecR family protein [Chitinophaga costaii]|uniref:FecR family protein n=1 Tax=Chitinophaga costaii TaxID=1335309 RepID=A0A1C4FBU0_9BACT|nr:FecR family protein [Chitinophaga costaii]PUZ20699.1 DUF4974 domain-containing protein [Chitinophaga costaii]SCC53448.1 FecR family protein [Chitinophaga costaii]